MSNSDITATQSHRNLYARAVWDNLVSAFVAGDLPQATRLGIFFDAVMDESDESFLVGLVDL